MKLWLAGAFAVAVALVLFAGPGAGVSSVQAIPIDTCGNDVVDVPDSGPTFDFAKACAVHDSCYNEGGTEGNRIACDREFLENMQESCRELWPSQFFKRMSCNSVANTYFLGVFLGGWAFFPYGEQDI